MINHMDEANEEYLTDVQEQISGLVDAKYRTGYEEHIEKEGNIWDNQSLLDNSIDEAVDLLVYLLTLKKKTNEV